MQPFHLIRVSQARPFLNVLRDHGASLYNVGRNAGLDLSSVLEEEDGVIGEFALWQFIEAGARLANRPLLGYECAEAYPVSPEGILGDLPLRQGNTLAQTLEYFTEDVMRLSTASYYSLDLRSADCWFRRAQAFGREHASWQTELYTVALLIQITRFHTAEDWLPKTVRFGTTKGNRVLPKNWQGIAIEWDSKFTEIQVSGSTLALPPHNLQAWSHGQVKLPPRPTFTELIETQIRSGSIGIEQAARQLGLSRSTLQRYLKSSGTSYQQELDGVRRRMACEILSNTTTPVADIATTLGYQHIGNFTRAFTRWTGETPSAYRD